jgi:hypothetical protein
MNDPLLSDGSSDFASIRRGRFDSLVVRRFVVVEAGALNPAVARSFCPDARHDEWGDYGSG